jgi:hypothetical protein
MKDEILEELWQIKDKIARETNYNTQSLFERLKKIQAESNHSVVNRTKQRKKQFI